jgi:peptidoglycan/xylan/chitin deacetylase (PgdA/CDA1 family)
MHKSIALRSSSFILQRTGELKGIVRKTRSALQWLYANFLLVSGVMWWTRRRFRNHGAVLALTFHRVLDDESCHCTHSQPEIVVREQTFRRLLTHILRHYEPVQLTDALPGTAGRLVRVVFTFDDGWEDNYRIVFPMAREFGIPVLIFITPGLLHQRQPFWPEQVVELMRSLRPPAGDSEITALIEELKKCGPAERERRLVQLRQRAHEQVSTATASHVDDTLLWQEIVEMHRGGVTFGSHTQTHMILTTADEETVRREVVDSKKAIESALERNCDTFSYPNGNWSPEAKRILAESGYRLAVTTQKGAWLKNTDPLCIPRVNVYEENLVGPFGHFSPAMFEYTTLWKAWRATPRFAHKTQ